MIEPIATISAPFTGELNMPQWGKIGDPRGV
jgi:hypothetical protein